MDRIKKNHKEKQSGTPTDIVPKPLQGNIRTELLACLVHVAFLMKVK